MSLADAVIGEEYIVKDIEAEDEELKAFLFRWVAIAENRLRSIPISKAAVSFPSRMPDITLM